MSSYEMSFKLRHISTATKKSGKPPSVSGTVAKAKDRLTYITREDAADEADIVLAHNGEVRAGVPRDEARAIMRKATDERAKKHRKGGVGVRLMDTLMVSLPNDATREEQRQMAEKMVGRLVGRSEAHALAAIHTDKKGNNHLHIAFLDGLEPAEYARLRNPDAKRVRRMEYGKLNEGGKPKELRKELAGIINSVARPQGRRTAEHRSFKERGVERQPQIHEGPQVQDKAHREDGASLTDRVEDRAAQNLEIIAARAGGDIGKVPSRWKRTTAFLDFWARRLGLTPPPPEKPAPEAAQRPQDKPLAREATHDQRSAREAHRTSLWKAIEQAEKGKKAARADTPSQRPKRRHRRGDVER